ncbi:MAG TPA: serine hydrolase domain-containing protein [Candidatus Baltobacteraceae bacterium]
MRSSHSCNTTILAAAAAIALLAPSAAPAQTAPAKPTLQDALDAIASYAPQALAVQGAPGASIAITDPSHTLEIVTVGYADNESKTPVTPQTRFGIGSITKSFTAGSLLQLRDAGRFDPQKPVTAYLPWFSIHSKYRPITSADLFTHSSGLPDGGLATGLAGPYELRDWETGFAPGTHWSYSNVGYDTLGLILEKLDGTDDYGAIVRRRIFAPLGMNDTVAVWSPQTLANAARGYLYVDDDRPVLPGAPLTRAAQTHYEDPAGSILTTPGDMAKYMRYIINRGRGPHGRLLSRSSWNLLTTAATYRGKTIGEGGSGTFAGYAYGLGVHTVKGDRVVGHTGGVLQYTACMQIDLTRGYGAIAMSNIAYDGPRPCGIVNYAIAALVAYAKGDPLPAPPKVGDPLRVRNAAQYAGTYALHGGSRAIAVRADGTRLTLDVGAGAMALAPAGGDDFIVRDPAWGAHLLQFGRDKHKRVVEAFWGAQWFTGAEYRGPTSFPYPTAWNAYVGRYETLDANGYYNEVAVIVRKGKLVYDDGTPLTPLGGGLYRVGADTWSPERARFGIVLNGKAQVLRTPGADLYRSITSTR